MLWEMRFLLTGLIASVRSLTHETCRGRFWSSTVKCVRGLVVADDLVGLHAGELRKSRGLEGPLGG